jgi:hypothetical protein
MFVIPPRLPVDGELPLTAPTAHPRLARRLRRVVALSFIAIWAALIAPMAAAASPPELYPAGSQPLGKSYGEWSALWWQQAYSSAVKPGSPFSSGNVNCAQLGTNGVVFLVGTTVDTGPTASRRCDVPANKALLMPLINAECSRAIDHLNSDPGRRTCARDLMDAVDVSTLRLQFAVHGKAPIVVPPSVLTGFRVDSPAFTWTSVANNPFGVPVLTDNPSAANGFFVMLHPLPPGKYDLSFGGAAPALDFSTQANYTLTVR